MTLEMLDFWDVAGYRLVTAVKLRKTACQNTAAEA
jgi:hypothetical protein